METVCGDCGVRDRALCSTLDESALQALSAAGHRRSYARGDTIAWAGEPAATCANVISGVLKLVAGTVDGREQIVGLVYPGDFVGQPFASSTEHAVVALGDVELCVFGSADFRDALNEHVPMQRLLLERTLGDLQTARGWMLLLARMSAREKVARLIADMAARLGGARCTGAATFDLPVTRGEMAGVLGLTIETVSRQLAALKAAGVIALSGTRTVAVRDRAALAAYCGD